MTDIYLVRTLSGFSPGDDHAVETMKRWPIGTRVKADCRIPRAARTHKRYWALVKLIYENTEQFRSADMVHQFLKIRAGHCTPIVSKRTGEVFLVPDSISYDTLDETEFQQVWRRIVDVVCEEILPGVDQDSLEYEIQKLCGMAA